METFSDEELAEIEHHGIINFEILGHLAERVALGEVEKSVVLQQFDLRIWWICWAGNLTSGVMPPPP